MINSFETVVASNPDKENVVFEIYYGSEQFAEVSNEDGENMRIEIYPSSSMNYWSFNLQDLQELLNKARIELK